MVFDLRRAMLKKEEFESARLMEFEFRHRARTFRLLAKALGLKEAEVVKRTARMNDEGILERLADELRRDLAEIRRLHGECAGSARAQLIRELGDPTPHRLA